MKNRLLSLFLAAGLSLPMLAQSNYVPSKDNLEARKEFQDNKFGIFLHYGIYSMVIFRGRLFCNTICPVGTLLSLFSRYSLFRISFDSSACTHCGNCEHTCKAEAIDSKAMTVDTSRCVDCFNCTSSCPKGGLKYRFLPKRSKETATATTAACNNKVQETTANEQNSRRNFLTTSATIAASLPVISVIAAETGNNKKQVSHGEEHWSPTTPPGSISLARFKDKCTGCQICVVHCPTQVLRPTGMEYGLDYMVKQ